MRRRRIAISASIVALLVCAGFFLRAPYHEWRMQAAMDDYERLRQNGYSVMEDVWGLVRGEPLSYQDYENRAREHQEALVRLGWLQRREFDLTNSAKNATRQDELAGRAIERVSRHASWSMSFSTGGTSVVITDKPDRFKKWETLVREFDAPKGTNETAGQPKSKPAC
jgi:hypothetical protein